MAEERVERRLTAILAADVAGYSRLMGTDEEGTLAQLKGHRRALIDPKIGEYIGRIIKTTGDGMLVEFASVVNAVRCAVEIQRGMFARNTDVPQEKRIEFRVGVNVGDIIIDDGDIFGDGVNVAARLEGVAEPGGICVSGRVQEDTQDKLDVAFEDAGEQRLKNIARPVRVYRVRLDGKAASAKTDLLGEQIDYWKKYKERLTAAIHAGPEAVKQIADEPALRNFNDVETGTIVDLFLSLRDVEAYAAMIDLYDRMPVSLQREKTMREQVGFALNRAERFGDAEKVLKEVIAEFGPSSEANGLLGRIYKDRWTRAQKGGRPEARSLLRRAIDAYLQGFEADWRDAYPGVNALTLMEWLDTPDPRKAKILPVVNYSVTRKAAWNPDYWDYATLLELAVLGDDHEAVQENLSEATLFARHAWEVQSTKRNLSLIRKAREARKEDAAWIEAIENELQRAADAIKPLSKE